MKGLAIDTANVNNQRDVVKNEVRVNVINQPYGGFPWIDLPMRANSNWYNAHNFYGDMGDLDKANLADAQAFFHTYYAPNNAVLVVTGDISVPQVRGWVQHYFAAIPRVAQPRQARYHRTEAGRRAPQLAGGLAGQSARRSASAITCRLGTRPNGTPSG